jgi:hypothetical protein
MIISRSVLKMRQTAIVKKIKKYILYSITISENEIMWNKKISYRKTGRQAGRQAGHG